MLLLAYPHHSTQSVNPMHTELEDPPLEKATQVSSA